MNDILINYIVQAILGAASGYITNDYAINMLFKEYTPLKIGGVIKKTRGEFIENISSMVENDIINKDKLYEIFDSDDFKEKFEKLTDDFYENCLYKEVGKDKFSNIEGFEETLKETDLYIQEILNEHLGTLIGLVSKNFDINIFLTDLQAETISDSLYKSIKEFIENSHVFENLLKHLYENNKSISPKDILGENIKDFSKSLNNLFEMLTSDADYRILDLTGVNDAFNEAIDAFYNKQIKDIIKIRDDEITFFISFLSEEGGSLIEKACQSLFSYARSLNKSIYSLVDGNFENSLKEYVKENLPYITESIVEYVRKNSIFIDKIIEDSIDEVIKDSDGIRAKLLSTIKNTYLNNLSKKFNIVDKIIIFIKNSMEAEKLSSNISSSIIKRLDKITVSEIIIEAENNGFHEDMVYRAVLDFIEKNGFGFLKSTRNSLSNLYIKDFLPKFDFKVENALSNPSVKGYLNKKSKNFINNILSKEFSFFINEDNLDDITEKAAGYFKMQFHKNEEQLKNTATKLLKQIKINNDPLKNNTTINFVEKESFNKYKEEIIKLKDTPLTLALDKLNSVDNISKNSSETLRKYLINNTDVILKGSVKGIVTDNLNKLSDEELIEFANDFIGKELKPIMFFGGILGIIAGVILALFQNKGVNPSQINIANMLTYSFVGFITNVIAINMIFKPYKENKFLSKIPFFRNFSVGYIIKNQDKFAKNTAYFIDKSLLSKKSINELFEKHKNNIKNSFTKNIVHKNYATLNNLLLNNKESTVKGTFSFLKNKAEKNLHTLSSYIYEKISSIQASTVLSHNNINYLSNYAWENLNSSKISKRIYPVLADKKLSTLLSQNCLTNYLQKQSNTLYDNTIYYLNPNNLTREIYKYNNKYIQYTNKNIDELVNINDEKLLAAADKVNSIIFSEEFQNNINLTIINLFNKLFNRNKTFEELFDGKIKLYIDKKQPEFLANINTKIKSSLIENTKIISNSVKTEIKNNLGLLERGMFSFMGGEEIIDELLTKIMTDKLPKFMDVKKDEINNLATGLIDEKFYKAKLEVLYTKLNSIQIKEVMVNYISINKEKIENKNKSLMIDTYNKVKHKNLNSFLSIFYLDNLETIAKLYENELNAFTDTLNTKLLINKDELRKETYSIIDATVEKIVNLNFSHIFDSINENNIDEILKKTIELLNKDETLQNIINSFIKSYKEYIANNNLNYFLNKEEFINSTDNFVHNLLINDESEKLIKKILLSIINNALESNFSFIDFRVKEYIINKFVDGSIESLRRNLDELLKSVEFDKIAAEEIEKMEPEKIHQMFDSFAGKYFKRLMVYGFGGFVFGINIYVGFSLAALKILSELFKKD